jgi:hypothetical protein
VSPLLSTLELALLVVLLEGISQLAIADSSTIFRAQDAPYYRPGMYATIGMQAFLLVATLFMAFIFWTKNRAADRNHNPIQGVVGWRYTL